MGPSASVFMNSAKSTCQKRVCGTIFPFLRQRAARACAGRRLGKVHQDKAHFSIAAIWRFAGFQLGKGLGLWHQ